MSDRTSSFYEETRSAGLWIATLAVGVVAIVLGYIGFRNYALDHHEAPGILNPFYQTLQAFILHTPHLKPPISWQLEVARLLAPVVLGFAAVQAFLSAVGRFAGRTKVAFWRDHLVLCGLGAKGIQLVRDFRRAGDKVVVIEKSESNEYAAEAWRLGATVLAGDATDPGLLAKAGVERCRHVAAVTGDDGVNLQIAATASGLVGGGSWQRHEPIECYVHVLEPELRGLLRRDPQAFPHTSDRFRVTMMGIDPYENAARLLFRQHPLDHTPITRREDPCRVHLVVVGFDAMGENVLLQAARIAHFANGSMLRATVFDPACAASKPNFDARYPFFPEVCEAAFESSPFADAELVKKLAEFCKDAGSLVTYVMCWPDDGRNVSLALKLLPQLGPCRSPILVRMSSRRGRGSLFTPEGGRGDLGAGIRSFGAVEDIYTREMLLHEELDLLAKRIHEDFVKKRREEDKGKKPEDRRPENDPALVPWTELRDDYKDSNRRQADHIPVKLRALGYHSSPPRADLSPTTGFSDEQRELLAEMEHRRWMADAKLASWTYAPGPKDPDSRTTPYLVPWKDLPESVKKYDREAVKIIPDLLNSIGLRIY